MERDSKSLQDKLEAEKEALRLQMEDEERSKSSQEMKNALEKEKADIEEKLRAEQERLQRKFQEEEKLRKEKEKEMASKLEKSKESSNELIELFDKVKKELDARKKENDEGNSEVRDL